MIWQYPKVGGCFPPKTYILLCSVGSIKCAIYEVEEWFIMISNNKYNNNNNSIHPPILQTACFMQDCGNNNNNKCYYFWTLVSFTIYMIAAQILYVYCGINDIAESRLFHRFLLSTKQMTVLKSLSILIATWPLERKLLWYGVIFWQCLKHILHTIMPVWNQCIVVPNHSTVKTVCQKCQNEAPLPVDLQSMYLCILFGLILPTTARTIAGYVGVSCGIDGILHCSIIF